MASAQALIARVVLAVAVSAALGCDRQEKPLPTPARDDTACAADTLKVINVAAAAAAIPKGGTRRST